MNVLPKASSLYENGFQEIKLNEEDLELKKKRYLLENFHFLKNIPIFYRFKKKKENYQKIPNFMNEAKNSFGDQEERSYGTVGLVNIGNTCFLNTGGFIFLFLSKRKNNTKKQFNY